MTADGPVLIDWDLMCTAAVVDPDHQCQRSRPLTVDLSVGEAERTLDHADPDRHARFGEAVTDGGCLVKCVLGDLQRIGEPPR